MFNDKPMDTPLFGETKIVSNSPPRKRHINEPNLYDSPNNMRKKRSLGQRTATNPLTESEYERDNSKLSKKLSVNAKSI